MYAPCQLKRNHQPMQQKICWKLSNLYGHIQIGFPKVEDPPKPSPFIAHTSSTLMLGLLNWSIWVSRQAAHWSTSKV
jgi:hypothetical protein